VRRTSFCQQLLGADPIGHLHCCASSATSSSISRGLARRRGTQQPGLLLPVDERYNTVAVLGLGEGGWGRGCWRRVAPRERNDFSLWKVRARAVSRVFKATSGWIIYERSRRRGIIPVRRRCSAPLMKPISPGVGGWADGERGRRGAGEGWPRGGLTRAAATGPDMQKPVRHDESRLGPGRAAIIGSGRLTAQ
jgi:hypothetical protein